MNGMTCTQMLQIGANITTILLIWQFGVTKNFKIFAVIPLKQSNGDIHTIMDRKNVVYMIIL